MRQPKNWRCPCKIYHTTSCRSTGSQRPCPLSRHISSCPSTVPKSVSSHGRFQPPPNTLLLGPTRFHTKMAPWSIHSLRTHGWHTQDRTSVTTGCILLLCMQCSLIREGLKSNIYAYFPEHRNPVGTWRDQWSVRLKDRRQGVWKFNVVATQDDKMHRGAELFQWQRTVTIHIRQLPVNQVHQCCNTKCREQQMCAHRLRQGTAEKTMCNKWLMMLFTSDHWVLVNSITSHLSYYTTRWTSLTCTWKLTSQLNVPHGTKN